MKRTPGPWIARELIPDGYIIKRHGTFEIHTPEYEVAGNVPFGAPFRKRADAVLAAASPELLEACQGLLAPDLNGDPAYLYWSLSRHLFSCAFCDEEDHEHRPDCPVAKARAAIAKAAGETS